MEIESNMISNSYIYGYYLKAIWRNEKTGHSLFKMSTKQELLLEEQYSNKSVRRNKNREDETWYTVICDASQHPIPSYDSYTPIKIYGHFMNIHQKEGRCWEFKIEDIKEASSEDTTTINYLASNAFPGITYENAVSIVGHFGADIFAFSERKDAVRLLMKKTGLKKETAEHMITVVKGTSEERKLFQLLSPAHISYAYAAKGVKQYGSNAIKNLKKNPYEFGRKIGLDFEQCDYLARQLRMPAMSSIRLKAAGYYALDKLAASGHTWNPMRVFYKMFNNICNRGAYGRIDIPMSGILTIAQGEIVNERIDEQEVIYSRSLREAEKRAAQNVVRIASNQKNEPYDTELVEFAEQACHMKYGTQQRLAFSTILSSRGMKILTGGPGTGKTTTIKGILLAYQRMHPDHKIKLCAPTGRAAQRMMESTGMEATTIHRLLDYRPYGNDIVHKDMSNPIEADLIVADEVSMMDIELFDIFLSAIPSGTTVVLVGDIHQLESVGPGAVLHDLLDTEDTLIQKCLLTEVFRQKGGSPIIENANRINEGITDLEACEDFQIINTKSEEQSMEEIKRIIQEMYDSDNPFHTQILCPARKGVSGINNINIVLQNILNSNKTQLHYGKTVFKVGDKILMRANNYDADYYNGDIGIITHIENGVITANIRDREYQLTRDMLDDIELSYGMTIHKSQGSEFSNVIVVMPMQPQVMLVRNLLYTAVTRAKKKVIIINEGSAVETAIKTDRSGNRRTLFSTYLSETKKRAA